MPSVAVSGSRNDDGVFEVTESNGFLPSTPALRHLPSGPRYNALEALMQQIPELLANPDPEALALQVEALSDDRSKEWAWAVAQEEPAAVAQAVYRDLSILVAGYLTEGLQKGGKPRHVVPAKIAVPLAAAAKRVDQQLIMEYSSFCLNNFYSVDGVDGHWDRLQLIRAFDGGPEEAAFILVHSIIEQNTPNFIRAVNGLMATVDAHDPDGCVEALGHLLDVQERMTVAGLQMFNASDPALYVDKVRPSIFGYKNNPDFPHGVVFEGVLDNQPQFLRGGTGAQSTIMPVLDAILGIEHVGDALLTMLKELEEYRPAAHRRYLRQVRRSMWGSEELPIRTPGTSAVSQSSASTDGPALVELKSKGGHRLRELIEGSGSEEACRAFNRCIMAVYLFRAMHVVYSELYISRRTNKEAATGGTPYKAYLRKHRDESIKQQIKVFPGAVITSPLPGPVDSKAALDVCEKPEANGIPSFLRDRAPFKEMIRKYGAGHPSLERKMFPPKSWTEVRA